MSFEHGKESFCFFILRVDIKNSPQNDLCSLSEFLRFVFKWSLLEKLARVLKVLL